MPSTPFSAAALPVVARLFGCAAWALWGIVAAGAEPAPLTDGRILDDTRVIGISISLSAADWEALRSESRDAGKVFRGDTGKPFTWRRADIVIDGVPIGSVGIRKKGLFGSLDSATPSLLVDFNRFVDQDPVDGLGRLTLNNNKQDRSLVSQSIAYRVFRAAGLAAPRVGVEGDALRLQTDQAAGDAEHAVMRDPRRLQQIARRRPHPLAQNNRRQRILREGFHRRRLRG
jgi:hypothetical protein